MGRIFRVVSLWAAAIAALLGPAVYAQQSQTPSAPRPAVKATAEEVVLDVVVRDKKGHRVDNLKPEDFQIFDNGEPKKIISFRLVQGGEAIGTSGTGSTRTQLDPLRRIRLVTMIFRCSDNNSRRLAHDAATGLLNGELPQNVYIAVMTIDFKLEVLQAFTNDTDLIRHAIDRATRSDVTDFAKETEWVRTQLEHKIGPVSDSGSTLEPGPGTNPAKIMDDMILRMIREEHSFAIMQVARATIYALLDVVREQYRLPGRKAVLYFSGGFVKPQELDYPFKQILSIANRSNVSFYTVDAHGLMTTSTNQPAINMLNRAGQTAQAQAMNPGDQWTTPDEIHLIDTGIASTRANPQTALEELAESTGGALIANTNDLQGPLHKLAEDIQTYYEISYNPEIKTYDGSFRKITIKLASSDLRVQSRSGYIALPPALTKGSVLHAFEVPLLTALDSPELPKAFGYEATAMHFRGLQGEPVCELIMDVPLAAVTLEKQGTGESSGRLSYVALLKDGKGEVVKKFQNERAFNVPAEKLDGFKASHFIYTEHFELPPGPYTVETAVLDGRGNRISARKSNLIMPPPSTGLAISSVAIIRNTKDKEKSTQDNDPLLIGDKVVSPTLSPVISKAGAETLPFYLVIYPDKAVAAPPQLVMEFSRNGKVLGNGLPQLGPPDQDGRIQYIAVAPLARFGPGEFTIRFIVKQGSESAEETASFTLQ
jgi:VWFA-related protein